MRQVKVIGAGGIGTSLLPFLATYLSAGEEEARITIIDGDSYEAKNAERQLFRRLGNKAKIKAGELAEQFEKLSVRDVQEFVTPENIELIIRSGDVVFLCVDNHKTRKLVSDFCRTLENITLISGGNELTDGNVQVYLRKNASDITYPLTSFHPEIEKPADRSPGEMSCEELAKLPSSRQLLVANMGAAWLMFSSLWLIDQQLMDKIGELYFDIVVGRVVRKERTVPSAHQENPQEARQE